MLSIIELSYNEVACYLAILRWIPAKRTVLNDYDKVGCKLEPFVDAIMKPGLKVIMTRSEIT